MDSAQDILDMIKTRSLREKRFACMYPIVTSMYVVTQLHYQVLTVEANGIIYFITPGRLSIVENAMRENPRPIGSVVLSYCDVAYDKDDNKMLKYRGEIIKDIGFVLNQQYSDYPIEENKEEELTKRNNDLAVLFEEACMQIEEGLKKETVCSTIPGKSLQDIQQSFDNQIKLKMIPTAELSIDNRNKLVSILTEHYHACIHQGAWSDDYLVDYVQVLITDAFNKGLQYQRDNNCVG